MREYTTKSATGLVIAIIGAALITVGLIVMVIESLEPFITDFLGVLRSFPAVELALYMMGVGLFTLLIGVVLYRQAPKLGFPHQDEDRENVSRE